MYSPIRMKLKRDDTKANTQNQGWQVIKLSKLYNVNFYPSLDVLKSIVNLKPISENPQLNKILFL